MSIYTSYVHNLHRSYPGAKEMSLYRFKQEWNQNFRHLKVLTPASDLCVSCIDFGRSIFRSPTQDLRLEVSGKWRLHLDEVDKRRREYNERNQRGAETWKLLQDIHRFGDDPLQRLKTIKEEDLFILPRRPCSTPATLSYDFDFAANLQLPHHARQEGPMYFASPLKVYVFGVAATFTWKQVFFLLSEKELSYKNANIVISLLDAFFGLYGAGEEHVQLHCDNCPQNKNNALYFG